MLYRNRKSDIEASLLRNSIPFDIAFSSKVLIHYINFIICNKFHLYCY